MKTKYDKLVQVRKTQVNQLEAKIAQIRATIKNQELEIDRRKSELNLVTTPKEGSISILQSYLAAKKVMSLQIKELLERVESIKKELNSVQLKYKLAMMEYEKSKHLKDSEIQRAIVEMKQKEQKDIDEVASQLFNNKKGS